MSQSKNIDRDIYEAFQSFVRYQVRVRLSECNRFLIDAEQLEIDILLALIRWASSRRATELEIDNKRLSAICMRIIRCRITNCVRDQNRICRILGKFTVALQNPSEVPDVSIPDNLENDEFRAYILIRSKSLLTLRDQQILDKLSSGYTQAEIASSMELSVRTIQRAVQQIRTIVTSVLTDDGRQTC